MLMERKDIFIFKGVVLMSRSTLFPFFLQTRFTTKKCVRFYFLLFKKSVSYV